MFSNQKINTGRQLELDIARGFAVLFMIFIHSQLFFANSAVSDSGFGAFNDFVGMVPAAPMFMFLLGVGINYTRKNDPKLFYKRGVKLIIAGYLLNFLKGFVPCIINAYRYTDIGYLYEGIAELLYVDILQFSGLAMIMFGFFKKIKANNIVAILFALGFAGLNILLLPLKVDNPLLASATGLLWGTGEYSYFPFLTWAFYPIAGFVFGSYLIRCTNKKKFYAISVFASALIFIGGTYLFNDIMGLPNGMVSDDGYYHHIISDNITFTGLVILEISLLSFVVSIIPKFLEKIFARWSKNVTSIFFIHWIILTWAALVIPMNSLGMASFVLLLAVVVPLSDYLAYLDSNRTVLSITAFLNVKSSVADSDESKKKIKSSTVVVLGLLVALLGFFLLSGYQIINTESGLCIRKYIENKEMEDFYYTGTVDAFSGEPDGKGVAYYSNGDFYQGEYLEGDRQGYGAFVGASGEKYTGYFYEDEYSGYGVYTDEDGSSYVGEFKGNDFNGQGTFTDKDGTVESGLWADGELIDESSIDLTEDDGINNNE